MLDELEKAQWEKRRQTFGKPCAILSLKAAQPGTVIKAETEKSQYVFEILDPLQRVVRFVRHKPHHTVFANRRLSTCRLKRTEIRIGGTIRFGENGNATSIIKSLQVLD